MNNWRFLATEIDGESFTSAQENVTRNHLEALITVRRTETDRLLSEPLESEPADHKFDFVMCNPPFFDSMDEADTNPSSCCKGSTSEMVFPGGEVAFIGSMIQESLTMRGRIGWFTSMIGRKSSLRKLLAILREHHVPTYRTTEFFQGRTKRWGIAWTFTSAPPTDASVHMMLLCNGTLLDAHPLFTMFQAKVLGKRKETHRRQNMTFEVPISEAKGS
jgi:23S rRNA A1618 N6-methylase RlmF